MLWLLLLLICWQPLYLLAMFVFHSFKGDTVDKAAYMSAFSDWFVKLISLVFAKPGV